MNNREQFEAFLVSDYAWANDALNVADFHGDDATGYYTGGDYIYEGQSCSEDLFWAWRGWQAASKASEQQLTESRREFTAANATIHNLELKVAQVVAENAGLKAAMSVTLEHVSVMDTGQAGVAAMIINDALHHSETPATDAYLAEVRNQGRIEGVNFAASRIAAAYNNGFIDKPLEDVDDVVRAILSAKGELGNNLPEDGLSGEYAEKALVEFAAQLRQGAEHE